MPITGTMLPPDLQIARGLQGLNAGSDTSCVLWAIPCGKEFLDVDYSQIGTYLQCAGTANKLTIEMRVGQAETAHHYVLGRKGDPRALERAELVESELGGVMVFPNEIFNVEEAVGIFQYYYWHDTAPEDCELRPL
jgi:hypothetical protein